ncbi:MAG: UDP-N-acetylmuramoyl-L-alanyl-D-glutamate--2,6-diaminopimelate ligase [Bacillota bacterium]|nr:UDP-N-acetylmuramoyl-L-alanyl-D-glutamate--2,6-diaminopimelate ligase [Bacillota bacterium]
MRLRDLCMNTECVLLQGDYLKEINNVSYRSTDVAEGDAFVCIKGARTDGHKYIHEAVANGAAAVFMENEEYASELPEGVTAVKVGDGRRALAELSAAYFGYPARKLITIGVTGTKGKTTTAHIIKRILEAGGRKTGMIGTTGVVIGDMKYESANTTPESYELHRAMADMVREGCSCVVMEVSSQALKLDRTAGIIFDYCIYLNLSEDHIGPGEHKDFREYLECKSSLFRQCRTGIINIDDRYAEQIERGAACRILKFGTCEEADYRIMETEPYKTENVMGMSFTLRRNEPEIMNCKFTINIPGAFSVTNAVAAIAVCSLIGVGADMIAEALMDIHVKGRTELLKTAAGAYVMIDFAHNRASMESVLGTLRMYLDGRLICIFGAGGDRSRERRFGMGEAAGRLADLCILTEDNPRTEKVSDINADIITGISHVGGHYMEIENRTEAVAYGIRHALPGDIVVILGKGHESYIERNGVREHYSDHEAVQQAVESH